MAMRLSGLMSGMDTESIVQELVAVKQIKVDELKKEQTKLEWKQDAWKELNNKIKKLYNGALSNLRFQSAYSKKVTKVSDSSVADVIASDTAMDSVQSLRVTNLARTGYLTGAEVKKTDGSKCTSGTKLADMGIEAGSKIEVSTNGKTVEINVTDSMTLADLTSQLSSAGLKANFDSKTQRLFVGASESGEAADFTITAANDKGTDALSKLGILVYGDKELATYQKYADMLNADSSVNDKYTAAADAEIAKRLASYIAKAESLESSIAKQEENLTKIKEAYKTAVGEDNYSEAEFEALVADTDEAKAKRDELQARIDELEAKKNAEGEDAVELTEEETAELEKLTEQMKQVNLYVKAQETLETSKADLSEAKFYFEVQTTTDENGETVETKVASAKLTDEVKAELDAKIAKAKAVLADGSKKGSDATKVVGEDAEIYLNGARFTDTDNTFEINGLTITCNAETGDKEVTLTTQNDTSGIYDMIKNFITEYSELINEMDKLYNAESQKDMDPLTDDEKYLMSEKEVEKWEEKIKDSLLRKDATLYSVSSAFKEIMSSGFSVGGKTMYLSNFGIDTLGYFEAADNERHAYHIDGDEDDEFVSNETNTLKAMISSDPDAVMDFFSQLTKSLYEKTSDLMKSVKDYSSSYTVYEDKKMQSDYDDYTKRIAELEEKLADYEDKWYAKFSAMETAMAKMQSNANAITGLLGG